MSEISKSREAEAIRDAVELAFWGIEFEDATNELLACVPEGEEGNVFECHMRQKSGFDSDRGLAFMAAHIRGVLYDQGHILDADMVLVIWDDGMKVGVDVKDLFTEQRVMDMTGRDEKIPLGDESKAELYRSVKSVLAQLTDIAS